MDLGSATEGGGKLTRILKNINLKKEKRWRNRRCFVGIRQTGVTDLCTLRGEAEEWEVKEVEDHGGSRIHIRSKVLRGDLGNFERTG